MKKKKNLRNGKIVFMLITTEKGGERSKEIKRDKRKI